jgi:hypothetical protein
MHPSTAVIVAGFLIPYIIAYLVHLPNTKAWRVGLYPLGLIAGVWTAVSVDLEPGESAKACEPT